MLKAAAVGSTAVIAAPVLLRTPGANGAPLGGIHVTLGPNPARDMAITWSTPNAVERVVAEIGLDDSFGRKIEVDTRRVRGVATRYHHALADDLEPGRVYRYRLSHHGSRAVTGTFRTPPGQDRGFRFTAFGDQGVGEGAAESTSLVRKLDSDLHFHVGDLCYANPGGGSGAPGKTDPGVWDSWFRILSPVTRSIPWMPAVGNHEMETGYGPEGYAGHFSRFVLPETGPKDARAAYWFRYGNVAFFALDANDVSYEIPANRGYSGGSQDAWLERTLKQARQDTAIDFIVCGYHHCSYCSNVVHGSDAGVRDHWGPLFDRYEVDLVINGHNHCYERTHPLRAGTVVEEIADGDTFDPSRGTTYITAGGGGQTAYQASLHPVSYVTVEPAPISPEGTTALNPLRVPETATWSGHRYNDLSMLVCDVKARRTEGGPRMELRALRMDGTVLETLTLTRA